MCEYCDNKTNDFVIANQGFEYSGIEIALNRQGMLRVRTYPHGKDDDLELQDIVELKYCPLCGKRFIKDYLQKRGIG